MIKLYSFGANFGVADPSPYVLKVDVYMRMADIEFTSIPDVKNLQKAPKGKLPFITDGNTTIADSQFIIGYLQEKFNVTLDAHLSAEQKSVAHLIGKSLDENLYWCLIYSRWIADDTWPQIKQAFFGSMPFPLNKIVPILARRDVISAAHKQGIGRHSAEEITIITRETLQALSILLGKKTYFFGENPSTFDATAFAFLSQLTLVSIENDFTKLAHEYSNLVAYCENIQVKYYSELSL